MKHLWSGVAAAAVVSLAATAAAQAPLSPSGAVNSREPPAITFPGARPPFVGPRRAGGPAGRCGDQAVEPGARPAPAETVTRSEPDAPGAAGSIPAASAAPEETATSRTEAASTAGGENKTAVVAAKAPGAGRRAGRLAAVAVGREPGGTLPWR